MPERFPALDSPGPAPGKTARSPAGRDPGKILRQTGLRDDQIGAKSALTVARGPVIHNFAGPAKHRPVATGTAGAWPATAGTYRRGFRPRGFCSQGLSKRVVTGRKM